jgi:uncharacterized protein (TIGR02246 family)
MVSLYAEVKNPEVDMHRLLAAFALVFAVSLAGAQSAEADIRAAMDAQVSAWNRGDIPAFMQSYEDSPQTTFIGAQVRKGYQPILARYQQAYANAEQMGKLSFTDLEVRMLPSSCGAEDYAVVTGKFHLQRTTHGEAAKDDGVFSLTWHKGARGWKIIVDHTS